MVTDAVCSSNAFQVDFAFKSYPVTVTTSTRPLYFPSTPRVSLGKASEMNFVL